MRQITLKGHVPTIVDELRAILEEALEKEASALRSPELLDNVIWQILIAFLVNVAAGVFTELEVFAQRKTLTRNDLEEIRKIVENRSFEVAKDDKQALTKAVEAALPGWLNRQPGTAMKITETLLAQAQDSHGTGHGEIKD